MKNCRAWEFLKTTNDFTIDSYLQPNLTNAVYLFIKETFSDMESLFSLILVGKAEVFVICMVEIKLSIVLFEIRCCITKDVKFSPQKVESV